MGSGAPQGTADAPMGAAEISRIVKWVGRRLAAEMAGVPMWRLDLIVRGNSPLPPEASSRLRELAAVAPMSRRELSMLVAHAGGPLRTARLVGCHISSIEAWRDGRRLIPFRFIPRLRRLWETPGYEAPKVQRVILGPHHREQGRISPRGRAELPAMSAAEFREYVALLGGIPRMRALLGGGLSTLYRYASGQFPVARTYAWALRALRGQEPGSEQRSPCLGVKL